SYYQDAGPGTEGFLDTCLHRISAARHARLIDYTMRNGRNSATFVHFVAVAGSNVVVPQSTKLVSRIGVPLVGEVGAPGPVIPVTADFDSDPALTKALVFETMAPFRLIDTNNEIRIHSWADAQCCLAKGATSAFLYTITAAGIAIPPDLVAGEYLLLEEVLSPVTGAAPDADPRHRQVVLIEAVEVSEDAAFTNAVPGGTLTPRLNVADPALPLLHVTWAERDALAFPLCVSALTDRDVPIDPVSVARGNTIPADHGRTVERDSMLGTLVLPDDGAGRWPLPSLALPDAPLSQTPDGPSVRLSFEFAASPGAEAWTPVPNLLDSGPFDQHFVAETDNAGDA
ncbi:hypothetical protein AB4144_26165, partial [Rhizobiaceae sp. 2RAB30]